MRYQSSYKFRSFLQFLHPDRTSLRGNVSPELVPVGQYGYSLKYQGLQLFSTSSRQKWTTFGSNMVKDRKEKVHQLPAAVPASPRRFFPYWPRWVLGSILTFLHFSNEKWAKLKTIEGNAEVIVEEVENVAEMVEKVAIVAEKVSSEVVEKLPENGKLKETALFVERVSKKASEDAQLVIDFIHKVDELKHDIEDLETVVEPVVNSKH
ncbi:hypothetical protein TIFTF001_028042 [Ficus carica]|uniref:Uncharacterized protein n=1 Tax=Ficus carica TaxID=3494 RepID=A0AA88DP19_FICCA|nr:hypothetical protein TIFTF001_028042 [Ficus carica]